MQLEDINAADLANLTAQGYSEADLAMLAKSEVDSLLAVPGGEDEGGASNDDPHAAAAAEQDSAAAAAAAAAAQVEADAAAKQEAAPFIPEYRTEVPSDAAEQIKALKTEEAAAFKRLMDGELDADEYQAIKTRVDDAVDDLKTQALTASVFKQANEQAAEQSARAEWTRAENAAFNAFKTEGLDYKARPALLAAYNTNLKALGADPKNENRDAPWFLAEAHRLTKEDFGVVTPTKKALPTARTGVDLSELPPTLRGVPAAATSAVNTDEFAHMRNLTGIALERAHAAMTDAQRDRWMAE